MAVDPKDDDRDDDVDDDDDARGPSRRVPKVLGASKSLPSVENALDDFIVRANQKLLDVSEFTPEVREQGLREEIDDLKKQLAAAVTRAELAEEAVNVPAKRPWGAIAGAFVVGCASMFAITLVMRPDDTREAPAAVAPSSPQPGTTEPTAPAVPAADTAASETSPTTDTATQPPVGSAASPTPIQTDTPATTAQAPATPATTAQAPATTAQPEKRIARTPPKTKPPKQGTTRRPPPAQPESGDDTTNTTKPPPADKGSGEGDLYNPF